jgi:hypothetical protein
MRLFDRLPRRDGNVPYVVPASPWQHPQRDDWLDADPRRRAGTELTYGTGWAFDDPAYAAELPQVGPGGLQRHEVVDCAKLTNLNRWTYRHQQTRPYATRTSSHRASGDHKSVTTGKGMFNSRQPIDSAVLRGRFDLEC